MDNYEEVQTILAPLIARLNASARSSIDDGVEPVAVRWRSLWSAVAAKLLQDLESGSLGEFEDGFRVVRDGLNACNPLGRQAGVTALFGDFTRRAIAASVDRTRFVDWLGPVELSSAPAGRIRGRVLYFNNAKGRGKVLGSDRIVYLVYFSMIQGDGFRSLDAGQLLEFTALYGTFNSGPGLAAIDLVRLTDGSIAEPSRARDANMPLQPTSSAATLG